MRASAVSRHRWRLLTEFHDVWLYSSAPDVVLWRGRDEFPPKPSDVRPVVPSTSCDVTSTRASGSMVYGAASVASTCVPSLVTLSIVLSTNAENSPLMSPPFRVRSPP